MNKYLTRRRTGEFFRSMAQLIEHHDGSKGSYYLRQQPISLLAHISQDRKQRWDRKQGWTINFKEQIPLLRIHFLKKPHLPKQNNQIVVIYSNTLVNGGFQISHYIMLPMTFIGLMSLLLFLDQNVLSAHNQKFPQSYSYNIVQKSKVFF